MKTQTAIKQYEINGVHRFTEEDIYNDGCQPKTGSSDYIKLNIKANTVDELIQKLFSELCFTYSKEALELNACDEEGRIDIQVMEDENGSEASKNELASWKNGKKRLWLGNYSANIELVTRESVSL